MKFSGERMIPEVNKGDLIWAEHFVRYIFSSQFVKNKNVLDIACGSGFGTNYLAEKAKHVIGIDISEESIDYAKEKYSLKNIKFLVGDCENIPLPDNSIDVVVSFETLEHVKDYEKFVLELKRVSKPEALLILSTPNEKVFPKGNPFHLKEFNYKELDTLLKKYYKNNKFLFENNWFSAAVLNKSSVSIENLENSQTDIEVMKLSSSDPISSLYFVVLASDTQIPSDFNQTVGLFSPSIDFTSRLTKAVQDKEILEGQIDDLKKVSNDLVEELKSIYSSKTWKLADYLRGVKKKLEKIVKSDNKK